MITKVTGFILNSVPFKETSLILNILTKEYGLIGVIAKGVKSLKSPLRALVLPYTYGFFYIIYKNDKLATLKEVDIINPLTYLHSDITLIYYLDYIANLAKEVYKESENKTVFNLMIDVILKMNEGIDPAVLTNILEIKYLPFLGVGLVIDSCVICGSKKDIVTVDGDKGGFICHNCYHNEKVVSLKTIKLLRIYYYVDIAKISNLKIKKEIKMEIDEFLKIYYNRYTGIYLKSKDFVNKFSD